MLSGYVYLGISIHVPLAGDDSRGIVVGGLVVVFLSTSPLRGTTRPPPFPRHNLGISIHVPLAGDDVAAVSLVPKSTISIHVPLAGDDWSNISSSSSSSDFYPRPPCGGRPWRTKLPRWHQRQFLSTSPLRGTTDVCGVFQHGLLHFYPRPPCGGRPPFRCWPRSRRCISIHVPLAGDDGASSNLLRWQLNFYPRPPCGGRQASCPRARNALHFYPRPPCGGRRRSVRISFNLRHISIHVPLAGDDGSILDVYGGEYISIHVPLAGDDCNTIIFVRLRDIFLSTSPLRGTTRQPRKSFQPGAISIHVPLAGDDHTLTEDELPKIISIHVPLAGDDR